MVYYYHCIYIINHYSISLTTIMNHMIEHD